jgi:hypothetical protein
MSGIQFPIGPLGPGAFGATVIDNNGNPSTVLEANADFRIDVLWSIDPISALLLGGQWELAAYVESIGPGPELQVGNTEVVPLNGTQNYAATIVVPAGSLPNNPSPPDSGVYKIVTVLTHRNFTQVTDVAAIEEGPMVRIG